MGFLLMIPFLFIRFGLLAFLNKAAIRRAAHFPPMTEKELPAYWIYQLSNAAIFLYPFFLEIKLIPSQLFWSGAIIYLAGNLLLIVSMINFARPSPGGINQNGLYRLSRNPMYAAYFVYFLGCVILTQSFLLLGLTAVFQVSAHWIILAEERWCNENFGEEYRQYMKKVRRYI